MTENDITAREARIEALTENATLKARATVLRHALAMDDPLNSPSKEFCARIIDVLDGENPEVETLTAMFKAAKLKADAAEVLEVEEIGNSVGPVVSPAIARLEENYEKPIGEVARERHVDNDAYEELSEILEDEVFMSR